MFIDILKPNSPRNQDSDDFKGNNYFVTFFHSENFIFLKLWDL